MLGLYFKGGICQKKTMRAIGLKEHCGHPGSIVTTSYSIYSVLSTPRTLYYEVG